jgi:hypothetical protein
MPFKGHSDCVSLLATACVLRKHTFEVLPSFQLTALAADQPDQ